ncbi:MAG: signal peptidase I, partial [Calditrichae bacterium]|nr:signal peptidase I [Calditrichia bacterium]NIV72376.1 signal peptidase I [Calditrichia bacterium]
MTPKRKAIDNVKAILIALFAALVLRQFVIASYNVPTGSMKDTILIGDFMFVNKFVYGARTPSWIGVPFTCNGYEVPFYRFPSIEEPEPRDIIVFVYPKDPCLDYIKRCMAKEGQTLHLKNGDVFIDGQPEGEKIPLGKSFDPEERAFLKETKIIAPSGKTYE